MPAESPPRNQIVKDQQINELSDMVKELLREQAELKEQLNNSKDPKKGRAPMTKKSSLSGLNKKSSERVPRSSANSNMQREQQIKGPSSRERDSENPRGFLKLPLQVKPGEGNPKSNLK